jgi:tryptophan-rich sensory protein
MNVAALVEKTAASDISPSAALEPLRVIGKRWPKYLSGIISILLLGGLVHELAGGGMRGLETALPTSPFFYIGFLALYSVQPVADFVIFRRLWQMPIAGIVPILRKLVANEVLLGYSGEAYFYAWARSKLNMVTTPFAAIKDVSILSAVVGNIVTLVLLALASPFAYQMLPADLVRPIIWSAIFIMIVSLGIMAFRGRLFSLERRELVWVFGVHVLRTIIYTGLLSLCWHLALPAVPLGIWMILVTSRNLVTRLPLVPNKDIVFANLALLMMGSDGDVARLISVTVALTLLCHGIVLALTWLPEIKGSSA